MDKPIMDSTRSKHRRGLEPAVRRAIQASDETVNVLAERYGVNPKTVSKWRSRPTAADRPGGLQHGRSLALSADEEQAIIDFQRATPMSLNMGLRLLKTRIPHLTRSTLYRCLIRHGLMASNETPAPGIDGKQRTNATLEAPLAGREVPSPTHRPGDEARQSRYEAKREAILTIAHRSFLKHGYQHTSMSAIASELGGSKSTLWQHFHSKEELFTAYFARSVRGFNNQLAAALDPGADLESAILALVKRLLMLLFSDETILVYKQVLGASEHFQKTGEPFFAQGFSWTDTVLIQFLKEKIEAGHLRQCDPQMPAKYLKSLCLGDLYHRALVGIQRPDEDCLAAEAKWITAMFVEQFAIAA